MIIGWIFWRIGILWHFGAQKVIEPTVQLLLMDFLMAPPTGSFWSRSPSFLRSKPSTSHLFNRSMSNRWNVSRFSSARFSTQFFFGVHTYRYRCNPRKDGTGIYCWFFFGGDHICATYRVFWDASNYQYVSTNPKVWTQGTQPNWSASKPRESPRRKPKELLCLCFSASFFQIDRWMDG